MKIEPAFSKTEAEKYLKTDDKAVFLCELLNLSTIDNLTEEMEDEAEKKLLSFLN
jgi:hypothetical protein